MPRAKVNGIQINYRDDGQGEPLVMIGGFDSLLSTWWLQTRIFKKYYRVITFENRGSGKSEKPHLPYTIDLMAEDCLALMDWLSIKRAHLLGVSMGGLIAQNIAIKHAERVSKLVLGNCFSCIDDTNGPTNEMLRQTQKAAREMLNPMADLMLNNRLFRSLLKPVTRWKDKKADLYSIESKLEACRIWSSLSDLSKIRAATLVITGSEDRVIKPQSSVTMASNIRGSKLVIVKGGSHMLFLEKSGCFNDEVLKFLTS